MFIKYILIGFSVLLLMSCSEKDETIVDSFITHEAQHHQCDVDIMNLKVKISELEEKIDRMFEKAMMK